MQFDSENKNSKWYDAIKLEMESMLEYKVFKMWDKAIIGKHKKVKNPPKGYHRIIVHLVFAVKFDGRHKARLVADGHLTPESIENIYSGVVSLRNLMLVIFLGKLNNLELWGADIGNAYLEAFTDEKLYIVAGPESQELEGYILIFLKALYGLKSSGKRWAEVIHGILRDMKFLPSKAAPCIWLRKAPNLRCYEYIAVYVDDLCIAAESPSAIIQIFKSKYHLKVKGGGKLTYHLGADYFEDPDGTFVSQPKKYIDKLADTYKRLFNEDPPKGCLHFVNKTPVDWYSKKQAIVETATYGSEFVAAKTATEQIVETRQTLRYLGAPITAKYFLFGDNRSVVTSATLPHSTLTKRHNILAFHRVREAISAKLMAFYWIQSAYNLSDMLSKHWDHRTVYPMILKLLITWGNITLIPREATQEKEKEILNPQPEKEKKNEKQNKNMK